MPNSHYDLRMDPSTVQSGVDQVISFEFSCKKTRGDLSSTSVGHPESDYIEKSWDFTPTTVAK